MATAECPDLPQGLVMTKLEHVGDRFCQFADFHHSLEEPILQGTSDFQSSEFEFATARAAKRARQRERRRQGKAADRSVQGDGDGDGDEAVGPVNSGGGGLGAVAENQTTAAPHAKPRKQAASGMSAAAPVFLPSQVQVSAAQPTTPGVGGEPMMLQPPSPVTTRPMGTDAGEAAAKTAALDDSDVARVDVARLEVENSVLSVLRARVEQAENTPGGEGGGARLSATLSSQPAVITEVDAPPKLRPAPKAGAKASAKVKAKPAAPSPKMAPLPGGSTIPSIYSGKPMMAGFGGAAFAAGRGRPMSSQPMYSGGLEPHGRGRALEPPPGLQQLQLSSSYMPGSLSQPWIPGPGIPEDDEDHSELFAAAEHADPNLIRWHDLSSREHPMTPTTPSYYSKASFVATPAMCWSKTPTPPASPAMGAFPLPPSYDLTSALSSHPAFLGHSLPTLEGMAGGPMDPNSPGSMTPPMYVTVPVAFANCCPHCGNHFAMPPENRGGGVGGGGVGALFADPEHSENDAGRSDDDSDGLDGAT